jgi:hypothetical protein
MHVQASGDVVQPMSNNIPTFEEAIQLLTEIREQINPLTQHIEKLSQSSFRMLPKEG